MLSNPTYECRFYRSHLDMERGVFISLSLSVYMLLLVLATLHQHDYSGWFDVLLPFFSLSNTRHFHHIFCVPLLWRWIVQSFVGSSAFDWHNSPRMLCFSPFFFIRFSFAWFCVCAFFTLAAIFVFFYISAIFVLSLLLFQDVPFSFQKAMKVFFSSCR